MKRKLTTMQAEVIRVFGIPRKISASELGRSFGISHGSVMRIINGHCYKSKSVSKK